jgi:mxaJ protein
MFFIWLVFVKVITGYEFDRRCRESSTVIYFPALVHVRSIIASFVIAASWSLSPQPARALGVCADPDYFPYSNRAGEGFENKIAAAVSRALGEKVEYTWASSRGHGGFPQFLSSTLDAKKCAVIMSIPYGSREELTTRPYYISSYVFVFAKNRNYQITSMDSPVLKRIRIGFEKNTPAEDALKIRSMLTRSVAFDVGDEEGKSPSIMIEALTKGEIDVLITWQPAIGAFLRNHSNLEVVVVPNERALGAPEQFSFPMSMGVRTGDEALRKRLDDVIAKHQVELTHILTESGLKLFAQP